MQTRFIPKFDSIHGFQTQTFNHGFSMLSGQFGECRYTMRMLPKCTLRLAGLQGFSFCRAGSAIEWSPDLPHQQNCPRTKVVFQYQQSTGPDPNFVYKATQCCNMQLGRRDILRHTPPGVSSNAKGLSGWPMQGTLPRVVEILVQSGLEWQPSGFWR